MMTTFDLLGPLPHGTTVLEASAGTGKTYAIAALATRLVAEGVADLPAIMMVTFSRMATLELRDRVRARLERSRQDLAAPVEPTDALSRHLWACDGDERTRRVTRLADALATFDDATIATTHEFCHRMLAGLGTLADQEPRGALVEDLQPLVREATLDVFLRTFADEEQPPFDLDTALRLCLKVVTRTDATIVASSTKERDVQRAAFAEEVRAEVERRKLARGIYTFDDMLSRLRDALTDPVTGELACARLAARYTWVLIDEFQDTDLVQWEIVSTAFHGRHDVNVVLIGDPKQAIYAFRGADVRSYLKAVEATPGSQTLADNWRSDARLVKALEGFLAKAQLGDERIKVSPVSPRLAHSRLMAQAPWDEPVRIRVVGGTWAPESRLRTRVADDLVCDIKALIASGARIDVDHHGEVPVGPQHIAVLVRENSTGERILKALRSAGVPAVFSGAATVYASPAAQEWLDVLRAIAEQRPAAQHKAAITSLLGWTLADVANADDVRQTNLAQRIREWGRVLADSGMSTLSDTIMRENDVPARLLGLEGGERQLTDLRHVAQNLQAAEAAEGLGLAGLVDWLADRVEQARSTSAEDRTRRMETDEGAVTIMTIHGSKGLQFPLVYLPDVVDVWVSERDRGGPIVVHEGDGRVIDVGGSGSTERARRYQTKLAEDAGEELRKLYVALTRAQCQVTAWWIPGQARLASSPLQRMLFRAGAPQPDAAYPERHPRELAAGLWPGVALQEVPETAPDTPFSPRPLVLDELNAPRFTRQIDQTWRRTSYTGLTAGAHTLALVPEGTHDDDESTPDDPGNDELPVPAGTVASGPFEDALSPMAELAGGTQFGSLVHALLEHLDTSADPLEPAVREQARHWLARLPVRDLTPHVLTEALMPSLRTPLGPLAQGLTLAEIQLTDRLPELDFELELVRGPASTLSGVADLIEHHLPEADPLAAYPDHLRAHGIGEHVLSGFLTGSIDVLMRVGSPPRHLVVDYKTNRIGPIGAPVYVGSYTHAAMAEAMIAAHYPLQALLYSVATHRFLRWRQPGYDPRTHLGGVLYLFVRGMAGPDAVAPDGRPYGVFDWSPPAALVTDLSDLLEGKR